MTLIECFDRAPLENIAACLNLKPQRLIFLMRRPASTEAFIQRARDMGILLVTDADELDKEGWADIFKKATRV